MTTTIPVRVRNLALKHRVNVDRDTAGYKVMVGMHAVAWTCSVNPTAAQACAMIRRYLRGHQGAA